MESKRAKELADAHWNGYVGPLVKLHSADGLMYGLDEVLELCGWHYTTALQHGHRHGVEDERNGLFRPRIGHHPPAHPYYHKDELPLSPEEVKAINEAISPPSLCGTCIRQGCPVDCAEHTTECGEYLPQGKGVVEQAGKWPDPTKPAVFGAFIPHEPESAPLSLALPSITVEGDLEEVLKKYEEEEREWDNSPKDSLMALVECWDCIQAIQTFRERGGNPELISPAAVNAILRHHAYGRPVAEAKTAMLMKNAARFYYSPEVNERIILSGGKEW